MTVLYSAQKPARLV